MACGCMVEWFCEMVGQLKMKELPGNASQDIPRSVGVHSEETGRPCDEADTGWRDRRVRAEERRQDGAADRPLRVPRRGSEDVDQPYLESLVSGLTSNVSVYAATVLNQYALISNSLEPFSFTLQYDADGNLTNSGPWTYVWDGENRLLEACFNGILPDQNAMSRRATKTAATNTVLFDDWNLVREQSSS